MQFIRGGSIISGLFIEKALAFAGAGKVMPGAREGPASPLFCMHPERIWQTTQEAPSERRDLEAERERLRRKGVY